MSANWGCPDGELVLTVEQAKDRERWLAERRLGIGGSDVASLMGEGKYADATEYDVWLDKTGRAEDAPTSIQMEWGTRWEDAAAQKFGEEAGLKIQRRGMLRSKRDPLLLANADRLVEDGNGLEIKVVNQFTKMPQDLDHRSGVPAHWWWQMVMCILVTGRQGWYLGVAIGNSQWETRYVDRTDPEVLSAMELILTEIPAWWQAHIVGDKPPTYLGAPAQGVDEIPAGMKVEAAIPGLVLEQRAELKRLRKLARDAKAEGDQIVKLLQGTAGEAEFITVNGQPVINVGHTQGANSFKPALFKAAHPDIDLDPFYRRNKASRPVRILGGDEE